MIVGDYISDDGLLVGVIHTDVCTHKEEPSFLQNLSLSIFKFMHNLQK